MKKEIYIKVKERPYCKLCNTYMLPGPELEDDETKEPVFTWVCNCKNKNREEIVFEL